MLAAVLIAAFGAIAAAVPSRDDFRDLLLWASVVFGIALLAITELLSAFAALRRVPLRVAWLAVVVGSLIWCGGEASYAGASVWRRSATPSECSALAGRPEFWCWLPLRLSIALRTAPIQWISHAARGVLGRTGQHPIFSHSLLKSDHCFSRLRNISCCTRMCFLAAIVSLSSCNGPVRWGASLGFC